MKKYQVWTHLNDNRVQIDQTRKAHTGTYALSPKGGGWVEVVELEQGEFCYDLDNHGNGDGTQAYASLKPCYGHKTPRGYHTIWLGERTHTGISGLIDYKGPGSLLFAPPTEGYGYLDGPLREMTDEDIAVFDKYMKRTYVSQFGGKLSILDIPTVKIRSKFRMPVYYTDAGHRTQTQLCDCTNPWRYESHAYIQVFSRHAELFALWHKISKKAGVIKVDARWLGEARAIFDLAMESWVCPKCTYKQLSFEREITKFINSTPTEIVDRTVRSTKTTMLNKFLPTRGIVNVVGQPLSGKSTATMWGLPPNKPVVWLSSDNPQRDLWDRCPQRQRVDNGREVLENMWIYSTHDSEDELAAYVFDQTTLVEMCETAAYESGLNYDDSFVLVLDTVGGLLDRRIRHDDISAPQQEHRALLRAFPNAVIMAIQHSPKDRDILTRGKATPSGTSGWGAVPRLVWNVGHVWSTDDKKFVEEVNMGVLADIAMTVVGNDILPKTYRYDTATGKMEEITLL